MTEGANSGDHTVPAVRSVQATFVLAQAGRESLKLFAGDDSTARLALLSVFLFYLTTDTKEPEKVAGLLRIVADEIVREPAGEQQ